MTNFLAKGGERAGKGRIGRFLRDRAGATAVEFAFVAPMFFAVLLATLQIAVIFFAQSYLATVADATARSVLTNQTATLTPAQFQTLMCSNVTAMLNCNNIIVSLQLAPTTTAGISAAMPTFNANGTLKTTPTVASIPPNTKALLIVMYQWPVIAGPLGAYFGTLGNGNYLLTATEVFQTEPCSATSGC